MIGPAPTRPAHASTYDETLAPRRRHADRAGGEPTEGRQTGAQARSPPPIALRGYPEARRTASALRAHRSHPARRAVGASQHAPALAVVDRAPRTTARAELASRRRDEPVRLRREDSSHVDDGHLTPKMRPEVGESEVVSSKREPDGRSARDPELDEADGVDLAPLRRGRAQHPLLFPPGHLPHGGVRVPAEEVDPRRFSERVHETEACSDDRSRREAHAGGSPTRGQAPHSRAQRDCRREIAALVTVVHDRH